VADPGPPGLTPDSVQKGWGSVGRPFLFPRGSGRAWRGLPGPPQRQARRERRVRAGSRGPLQISSVPQAPPDETRRVGSFVLGEVGARGNGESRRVLVGWLLRALTPSPLRSSGPCHGLRDASEKNLQGSKAWAGVLGKGWRVGLHMLLGARALVAGGPRDMFLILSCLWSSLLV